MPSASTPEPRRRWRWVAVTGTTLAVTAAGITVASAATTTVPNLRFTKVYYNSPGTDTRSNASLNAEYVQITNRGKSSVTLTGWTIRDKAGHTHTLAGVLAAGKTLTVHTGKGTNGKPAGHRYWQSGNYVWNNTGDTATLRTGKTVVHTCTWGSTGASTTCTAPTPSKPVTSPSPLPSRTSTSPVPSTSPTPQWSPTPTPPDPEEPTTA